jgi:hypothetical protein
MNYSTLSKLEHEQPYKILVISLTFVVYLLLQIKTVEKHHGKSKTGANANQTLTVTTVVTKLCFICTTAQFSGFESRSGCEQKVNPIYIHDKSDVIHENGSWQEQEQKGITLFVLAEGVTAII